MPLLSAAAVETGAAEPAGGVEEDMVFAAPELGTRRTDVGGFDAVSMRARRLRGVTFTLSTLKPPVVREGAMVLFDRSKHFLEEEWDGDRYFSAGQGDAARSRSAFSGENFLLLEDVVWRLGFGDRQMLGSHNKSSASHCQLFIS